jgi:hypothetical protein
VSAGAGQLWLHGAPSAIGTPHGSRTSGTPEGRFDQQRNRSDSRDCHEFRHEPWVLPSHLAYPSRFLCPRCAARERHLCTQVSLESVCASGT